MRKIVIQIGTDFWFKKKQNSSTTSNIHQEDFFSLFLVNIDFHFTTNPLEQLPDNCKVLQK